MLNRKEKELKQREENRQYENGRLLKRLKECPNIAFKNYLKHHHIKTIAVYGAGAVGKELIQFQLCNYYSNNCKFLALDALLDSIL